MNFLHSIGIAIALLASPANEEFSMNVHRAYLRSATAKYEPGTDTDKWYKSLSEAEQEAVQLDYYMNHAPNH